MHRQITGAKIVPTQINVWLTLAKAACFYVKRSYFHVFFSQLVLLALQVQLYGFNSLTLRLVITKFTFTEIRFSATN